MRLRSRQFSPIWISSLTQHPLLKRPPFSTALPDKHHYKAAPGLHVVVCGSYALRRSDFYSFSCQGCFIVSTVWSQLWIAGHASSSQFSCPAWLSLCGTSIHPRASLHRKLLIGRPAPYLDREDKQLYYPESSQLCSWHVPHLLRSSFISSTMSCSFQGSGQAYLCQRVIPC